MAQRGFTWLELLIVAAIIGIISSFMLPAYERYRYRAKAAGVVVEAEPIRRGIQEIDSIVEKPRYRLQLENGPDGSILGCQAPAGSVCDDAQAKPAQVLVTPERLLIARQTIRVSAAPCHVDCPRFALRFSADAGNAPPTPGGFGSPPTPDPGGDPGKDKDRDKDNDKGKDRDRDRDGKGKRGDGGRPGHGSAYFGSVWRDMTPVSSAHAGGVAHAAESSFEHTNRVLYEFGEVMRQKAHASDNAGCLVTTAPCIVTIKY